MGRLQRRRMRGQLSMRSQQRAEEVSSTAVARVRAIVLVVRRVQHDVRPMWRRHCCKSIATLGTRASAARGAARLAPSRLPRAPAWRPTLRERTTSDPFLPPPVSFRPLTFQAQRSRTGRAAVHSTARHFSPFYAMKVASRV